jgi:endonuclease YncB( thermonuclease family)
LATDAYGRLVVDCLAPEIGSLSRAMVAGGHAKSWPHRYAGRLVDWPVEQLQALAEKRGLWACDAPSAQGWRRDCPAP